MIDIHVHILPNFDDGPQTLDESVAMARIAAADQIKYLVATPHSNGGKVEISRKLLADAIATLQKALVEREIPVRILSGVEVRLGPFVANMVADNNVFALNDSRYVLIELPPDHCPHYFEQAMFELQVRGFKPVLVHPERCKAFQDDIGLLYRFVERGILTQLTAGSIVGAFGKAIQDTARAILEHNLAHVIASDAHSLDKRPPILSRAVEYASAIVGADNATAMVTSVPEALISNQMPRVIEPIAPKKKRSWFNWR